MLTIKKRSKEFWVGVLVLATVFVLLGFGWLLGILSPFRSEVELKVLYAFAGGVEVGSPVRVSGVKVGRVSKIEFIANPSEKQEGATLSITLKISWKALPTIHQDSKFYINLAGIIGERYVEISPGSLHSPPLASGTIVRGIDPPRVDQLLSQGYGVFGKIQSLLEENEEELGQFLSHLGSLLKELNHILSSKDRDRLLSMLENFSVISKDVRILLKKIQGPDGEEFAIRLLSLIRKADGIDKKDLQKFFQQEGIRAKIF